MREHKDFEGQVDDLFRLGRAEVPYPERELAKIDLAAAVRVEEGEEPPREVVSRETKMVQAKAYPRGDAQAKVLEQSGVALLLT